MILFFFLKRFLCFCDIIFFNLHWRIFFLLIFFLSFVERLKYMQEKGGREKERGRERKRGEEKERETDM